MSALSLFPARVAFVNQDGTLTPEAYRALQALFNRVGGAVIGENPPVTVTVSASPFSYVVPTDGYVVVTGGTVTLQEYGRGTSFTPIGSLNSLTTVTSGDTIRITYTQTPKVTFIPR